MNIARQLESARESAYEGYAIDDAQCEKVYDLTGALVDLAGELSSGRPAEQSEAERGAVTETIAHHAIDTSARYVFDLQFGRDSDGATIKRLERDVASLDRDLQALASARDLLIDQRDEVVKALRDEQNKNAALRDKMRETQHENDALACEVARLSALVPVIERQRNDAKATAESWELTSRAMGDQMRAETARADARERERDSLLLRLDAAVGVRS